MPVAQTGACVCGAMVKREDASLARTNRRFESAWLHHAALVRGQAELPQSHACPLYAQSPMAAMDTLELISPTLELADAYLDMCREEIADDDRLSGVLPTTLDEVASILQRWQEQERIGDESTGGVRQSTYWLVSNGSRVLGSSTLRRSLPPASERTAGHIDYGIRPSERRKGYGTALLALTLAKAREAGMREAVVTCRRGNTASARVIERNGGVLLGESVRPADGAPILRYAIKL